MNTFEVYNDIMARTNGEIYIGVVGPVRTGKSTFIKRFMDVLVLPGIEEEYIKERTRDELPQSASGKTIMTTEPKFVPKEAAHIKLTEDVSANIRLIDCVGYMVDGAAGHIEGEKERMVKTPWFDYEIPFTKAAGIGTRKVIHEHATIGIVVTTDGSICGIERECYRDAESKTMKELEEIAKPFIVLVNSKRPYSEDAKNVVKEIESKYKVQALSVNCEQLKESDITNILEKVLLDFPISEIHFRVPEWVEMIRGEEPLKQDILNWIRELMEKLNKLSDVNILTEMQASTYVQQWMIEKIELDTGRVVIKIDIPDKYYYEMLSKLTEIEISGQQELVAAMKKLAKMKKEYEEVKDAFTDVRMRGYGVVSPKKEDIILEEPEIIKQGNKYGVKIHSKAPSIHLIKADIETEIAPIVGSEQQAKDLIQYIRQMAGSEAGIWGTNIFGKSVEELVADGMRNKISMINEESQEKLQDTMQKIVNDSNGGLVCIII